ncbi:MAG: nickel-dependent hydrogenase large subunit [Rhodospirillales bacterium]|nr:nickel-dependent hydrogenase large subunit [Rhodospirillales bacterium]
MANRIVCDIPLNRAEGDLEIKVAIDDGHVVDAWSVGTMFRGFEQILVGRGAFDGLVVTPRICGICSTTHLMAAAQALDAVAKVRPPGNAIRLRNLALMAETVQSDVRQSVLMFLVDFANPAYANYRFHAEVVKRYAPLAGERCIDVIKATKYMLEIVALIGGQWPHSSYMVPGGVAYPVNGPDIVSCRHILRNFRLWYEKNVLGCPLETWNALASVSDLDAWLADKAHRESDVAFLLRLSKETGLDGLGRGSERFLSYGSLDLPDDTMLRSCDGGTQLIPSGLYEKGRVQLFNPNLILEHVDHSWYADEPEPLHPSHGMTEPYASGSEGKKYSWSKAPRYDGLPAETGPLAERLIAGDPLFTDLISRRGNNLVTRQLARLTRPAITIPAMETWLSEILEHSGSPCYTPVDESQLEGEGAGLIQAARGALGHWVRIENGRISHYQIITPTAWNGSPRDGEGRRGPWEEALIGTPVKDPDNPVEVGHVVRSYDPCLVCTVHRVGRSGAVLQL